MTLLLSNDIREGRTLLAQFALTLRRSGFLQAMAALQSSTSDLSGDALNARQKLFDQLLVHVAEGLGLKAENIWNELKLADSSKILDATVAANQFLFSQLAHGASRDNSAGGTHG